MINNQRIYKNKFSVFFGIYKKEGLLSAFREAKKYLINTSKITRYLGARKCNNSFSDMPIIIGGCGRSGTTLLLTILSAHSHIYSLPIETEAFVHWDHKKNGVDLPRLGALYYYILKSDISEEVTRWCEKTPRNVLYFDKILSFFKGKVKLINIVRDGRDVLLSYSPNSSDSYHVDSDRWIRDVSAGLKYINHPQVLTIKYEDLILSYSKTMEKVCEFIGEKFSDELKDWVKNAKLENSFVQKNAWFSPIQGLHSNSIGKWKKPENRKRIGEVMKNKEVVKLLKKLNYL